MIDLTGQILKDMRTAFEKESNIQDANDQIYREMMIDYYRGNQLPYVTKYVNLTDTVRMSSLQLSFTNITQKIINRSCLTYINRPLRLVQESRQKEYDKVTKGKNKIMVSIDRYSTLLDYVGIKVEWDARENKKQFKYRQIIDEIYFSTDQYGDEVTSVWFPISPCESDAKKNRIMYEYWDNEQCGIVDINGKGSDNQEEYGFLDNVNYYGRSRS